MRKLVNARAAQQLLTAVVAMLMPVLSAAQPKPVTGLEKVQLAPPKKPEPLNTIQHALYQAINKEQAPDAVALLIKQNLDTLSRPCEQVMAYQIFRYTSSARTLKIKCARQPLMAMTVGTNGGVEVLGGDGSISDMMASDGRIYSVLGQTLQTYMAQQKARDAASTTTAIQSAAPITQEPVVASKTNWPLLLIILNSLLAFGAVYLVWRFQASRRASTDAGWALSSTDKDYMMDESREVYPNVFRHPRGFFISRGKRGKRRLFHSALAAMLYRDLGIKFGEIGE